MKNLFRAIFLLQYLFNIAQNQEQDSSSFAFSLGNKILLELHTKDSINYKYVVKKIQPFQEVIDLFAVFKENDTLFSKKPIKNTIEIIYCIGKTKDSIEMSDLKTVMMLRNNSNITLDYKADILPRNQEEFENTSVVLLTPSTKVTEFWPYIIDYIALYDFIKFKD